MLWEKSVKIITLRYQRISQIDKKLFNFLDALCANVALRTASRFCLRFAWALSCQAFGARHAIEFWIVRLPFLLLLLLLLQGFFAVFSSSFTFLVLRGFLGFCCFAAFSASLRSSSSCFFASLANCRRNSLLLLCWASLRMLLGEKKT